MDVTAPERSAARRAALLAHAFRREAPCAEALRRVLGLAASLVGVDVSVISLRDGEAVRALASDGRALPDVSPEDDPFARVEPGEALAIEHGAGSGAPEHPWLAGGGSYAAVGIVLSDGACVGSLGVVGAAADPLEASDLHGLPDLAALAAGALDAAELVAELADLRADLERLAATDPLTGLLNRRALHERLDAALALARRTEHTLALGVIEFVGLSSVAERHGASLADALLLQAAHALEGSVRDHDLVARTGDASFALAWQVIDAGGVPVAAQRALAGLAGPFHLADPVAPRMLELDVHACLGYALYPHDAEDLAGLLRAADVAAQRARELGEGVVAFAGVAPLNDA